MNNKKIGIVGWNTGENSFGVTKPYLMWIENFGEPVILTPKKGMVDGLDLIILPGGADLAPQSYGEVPNFRTGNTDVMKQFFYDNNLDQYIEAGVPIFGICLGFQQLCSKFGGKLIQHFPYEYSVKSRAEEVDKLIFNNNKNIEPFLKGINVNNYKVNSIHHQGIETLPDNCDVIATTKYLNIEAARFSNNIFGVQYHPEELFLNEYYNDELSTNIIKFLLN